MAGSVTLTNLSCVVYPDASLGSNSLIISRHANPLGWVELNVQLNGVDHFFPLCAVEQVTYYGQAVGGAQLFQDGSAAPTVDCFAYGGSGSNHFVGSTNGDYFFGGSGANTFDAGAGYTQMVGGAGDNTYNESATGSGMIIRTGGTSDVINTPPGATGTYQVY